MWGLNPRSLLQPSETLPVELTGTKVQVEDLACIQSKIRLEFMLIG